MNCVLLDKMARSVWGKTADIDEEEFEILALKTIGAN